MESYHDGSDPAIGNADSRCQEIPVQPRHRSIVVLTPPVLSAPLIWTAADDDAFCAVLNTLPTTNAQHCAAVIYDLLYDFRQQRIITNPCHMPVALIAGVAGYSKAAIWRNLPQVARAGLLVWRAAAGDLVTIQVTPPDLSGRPPVPVRPRHGAPPSTIPPSLRQLEADGWIALTIESNRQTITLLRDKNEVRR